jgi:hypothetical protein
MNMYSKRDSRQARLSLELSSIRHALCTYTGERARHGSIHKKHNHRCLSDTEGMMSYNGASVETESQTSFPHISTSIAVCHIQHQLSDTSDSQPRATETPTRVRRVRSSRYAALKMSRVTYPTITHDTPLFLIVDQSVRYTSQGIPKSYCIMSDI